jgi:hypothetical protein
MSLASNLIKLCDEWEHFRTRENDHHKRIHWSAEKGVRSKSRFARHDDVAAKFGKEKAHQRRNKAAA